MYAANFIEKNNEKEFPVSYLTSYLGACPPPFRRARLLSSRARGPPSSVRSVLRRLKI